MTQLKDGKQELIVGAEVEVIATSEGALSIGPFEASAMLRGECGAELLEMVEDSDGDAGEVAEEEGALRNR
ncbi:MAG TPA: hypothetical protein VN688_14760 [Gemmataceae bacterium]|nr:hypothetical protein [Gemmataceae bacterium]